MRPVVWAVFPGSAPGAEASQCASVRRASRGVCFPGEPSRQLPPFADARVELGVHDRPELFGQAKIRSVELLPRDPSRRPVTPRLLSAPRAGSTQSADVTAQDTARSTSARRKLGRSRDVTPTANSGRQLRATFWRRCGGRVGRERAARRRSGSLSRPYAVLAACHAESQTRSRCCSKAWCIS